MARGGTVRFRFETSALSGIPTAVRAARWQEALSAPYGATLELAIASPDEDCLLLLGQDASLTLTREEGPERRLTGVITEVEQLELFDREVGQTYARVRIEPALALLELSQTSRIFQGKTVPEILEAVLAEALGAYGREVELALDGSYPAREYCVQYRESNLAFVERLMEEEGISYAFDHAGDVERLVLRDRNSFPAAETGTSTVPFDPRTGVAVADEEAIRAIRHVLVPTTTKVTVRDHDWTSPAQRPEGATGDELRESYEFGLGRSLTISDYGGQRYGAHDGRSQAAVRLESLQRDARTIDGESRVIALAPGTAFVLGGHSGELDGEYLVLAVEHMRDEHEAEGDTYSNRFRCIPSSVPYRPARRREKPRAPSVQTAIVTGPAGEEIHTDSHGRVKVQFHWDLAAPGDETSSCWLRVQQPWAANSWGFVFVPRIGMEVVVHFEHGDPDRPIVHGCVYDSERRPPYPLPDEKTKSTIKSNSSPGGGGFNELRFEDLAGNEQVYLHAQKDLDEVVLNDHTTQVGGDQTNRVGNDQTQTIDGHQTEQVDGDQTMTVDGNRTVTVTKKFTEIVVGGEKRTVTKAEKELILSGGEKRAVVGMLDEHFMATEHRGIFGGQVEAIIGGATHTIKSSNDDNVFGMLNHIALGNYTLSSTGGTTTIEASSLINVLALGGMTVQAANVTLDSGLHVQIDPFWFKTAPTSTSAYAGASITLAAVNIAITGASASATGEKIELTGASLTLFGLKASAVGFTLTIGDIKKKNGAKLRICQHVLI